MSQSTFKGAFYNSLLHFRLNINILSDGSAINLSYLN